MANEPAHTTLEENSMKTFENVFDYFQKALTFTQYNCFKYDASVYALLLNSYCAKILIREYFFKTQ